MSVRMEQLGSYWTDFSEILMKLIFENFFLKTVEKTRVTLKSVKNNGTLHEDFYTFMTISR
jgi:hypothetical protein